MEVILTIFSLVLGAVIGFFISWIFMNITSPSKYSLQFLLKEFKRIKEIYHYDIVFWQIGLTDHICNEFKDFNLELQTSGKTVEIYKHLLNKKDRKVFENLNLYVRNIFKTNYLVELFKREKEHVQENLLSVHLDYYFVNFEENPIHYILRTLDILTRIQLSEMKIIDYRVLNCIHHLDYYFNRSVFTNNALSIKQRNEEFLRNNNTYFLNYICLFKEDFFKVLKSNLCEGYLTNDYLDNIRENLKLYVHYRDSLDQLFVNFPQQQKEIFENSLKDKLEKIKI